ncbi:GrpB family protein [Myxococcus xanthus]|uniref:GrpB family protein n=1 Tax=Myxococcus xanthus TaxID=34 RepID=A0AAE6G7T2_MYXXA|nr:GrpB family protein [Myxococcus xanthus]QDE72605.1 hypothetical protein BHS09_26285 [Myxococcus xanthus]QDE79885.1 hypothetical protein BHS08_26305 [Myxococcus xanthus]QDE87256.1 hypothetical protein BHS07_26855 [Myxococcus xanthus]QDF01416.1 hypothetical protein BHS05_26095 [Myxococcus xanthus]
MPRPEDIMRHYDADPDEDPWVKGKPAPEKVAVVPYDAGWPTRYAELAVAIQGVMGASAMQVEHVGSTAVPGLPAKPIIDIDLIVADPTREDDYVPALESLGYDLIIREPSWHQHRCLRLAAPRVNLHVFGPDCPEVIRHVMFRDWLREHDDDRQRYAAVKYTSAEGMDDVVEYNRRKEPVIRDLYARIFRAAGWIR